MKKIINQFEKIKSNEKQLSFIFGLID